MSRFNTASSTKTHTTNKAGGDALVMTPELKLVSQLLTSFITDQYYRTGNQSLKELKENIAAVDPEFAAKAAIYARNEFGMRSVTHVVAAEIASRAAGKEWAKRFYTKVVRRPDDMIEVMALIGPKNFSHAMRKGFAEALTQFDEYQLAKYRASTKSVSLVDVVNLVHPSPVRNEALTKLVNDELRSRDTFEAKLSEAGKSENSDVAKAEAWKELLESRKIGYFALLRNLRNIIEQAPELVDITIELLTDEKLIHKSLVLPFRFMTASEEIGKLSGREAKKVLVALDAALDKSCANVPKFDGETLVAVDTSGSMYPSWGKGVIIQAALFGAILAKSNLADILVWGDRAAYVNINPNDSIASISKQIYDRPMGGTNMNLVFSEANRAYERIIILSDEQSWLHSSYNSPRTALNDYEKRTGTKPFVYSWDLAGLGTLQFPERNVATLAGWSDKVFDIMKLVETDKQPLVNKIKAVEL